MNPFEKNFVYRWTHLGTGTAGERVWTGLSRCQFLEDLNRWNQLGQIGPHRWQYSEI